MPISPTLKKKWLKINLNNMIIHKNFMQLKFCRVIIIVILLVIVCFCCFTEAEAQSADMEKEEQVLFYEDFNKHSGPSVPSGWWVEGGEKVWVDDGKLRVKANPIKKGGKGYVCTVWYNRVFSGNLKVEFDAHVLNSAIDANNINFFFIISMLQLLHT